MFINKFIEVIDYFINQNKTTNAKLINICSENKLHNLLIMLGLILIFNFNFSTISAQSVDNSNKLHNISLLLGSSYNKVGDLTNQTIKITAGLDYEFHIPGVDNLGIGLSGMGAFLGDAEIHGYVPIYIYSNNQRFKMYFAPGVVNYKGMANQINYLPNQTFPDFEQQITAIAFRIGMGYEFYIKKFNLVPKLHVDFFDKYANVSLGINIGYKL